jgi:hypothetical protein
MRNMYQEARRVVVWIGPGTESSEQAMEFLKMMATAKKNADGGIWRGGIGRVPSDTSSELGPGEGLYKGSNLGSESSASTNSNELCKITSLMGSISGRKELVRNRGPKPSVRCEYDNCLRLNIYANLELNIS